MTRVLSVRQQENINIKDLSYPYSYLDDYDLTPKRIIGEPYSSYEECIDFPNCVTHYYWIHKGTNDEDAWRAVFGYVDKSNNIRYGFYKGECDYTGFDCRGDMELYVSDRYDVLIEKALSDRDYSLYIEETL